MELFRAYKHRASYSPHNCNVLSKCNYQAVLISLQKMTNGRNHQKNIGLIANTMFFFM